ncbi:MAG: hypothetical protein HWE34_16685 [Methylocystaceae bacterium]|nr:hypothetical protein [Methylocystaceae bacterium]
MHPFNDTSFDQPPYDGDVQSYMICTTPRVGGTLLGALLQSTQNMGVPHEYFHLNEVTQPLGKRWSLPERLSTPVYLEALHKYRTTPNGIFALKVHYVQLDGVLKQHSFLDFLKTIKTFVYVTRDDLLGQAVSYAKAHQTRNWSSLQEAKTSPTYDHKLIERAMEDILAQNAHWQKFFALYDIQPLRIRYEDIVIAPNQTCRAICQAMGYEPKNAFNLEESPLKKQRDLVNKEWKNRFRRDLRSF